MPFVKLIELGRLELGGKKSPHRSIQMLRGIALPVAELVSRAFGVGDGSVAFGGPGTPVGLS